MIRNLAIEGPDTRTLSNLEILDLEAVSGVALPEPYREFLLKYNGGILGDDNSTYIIPVEFQDQFIEGFSCVILEFCYYAKAKEPELTIASVNRTFFGRIPSDTLLFGRDPFGDKFLLGCGTSNIGKVYLWDHDAEGWERPSDMYHNVALLADSFSDFMESLTTEPP